jgi:hypothetical protein
MKTNGKATNVPNTRKNNGGDPNWSNGVNQRKPMTDNPIPRGTIANSFSTRELLFVNAADASLIWLLAHSTRKPTLRIKKRDGNLPTSTPCDPAYADVQ